MSKRWRYPLMALFLASVAAYNDCSMSGTGSGSTNLSKANSTIVGNPMSPDGVAALPQVYLNSNYPVLPQGSQIWTVGNGKQFQDCQPAIDAAKPGDVVSIDAGFVCSHIVLRNKNSQNGNYIVIQTANLNALPTQGTRLGMQDFPNLAIIETGSGTAIVAEPMASYYQLVGLEIRATAQMNLLGGPLVELGTNMVKQLSDMPTNIVLARDYIHGYANQDVGAGILFNGAAISVVDSLITEIHSANALGGRAISGSTLGAGPFKVNNNEIESAGAGFALATWTSIPGLIPSDVEFQHNYVHQNPAWKSSSWTSESQISLVNAQRILINGNKFENAYFVNGSTSGYAFSVSPSSSGFGVKPPGYFYWVRVQDITFTNNLIDNSAGVVAINYDDPQFPQVAVLRIDIQNNLAYGIGAPGLGLTHGMIRLRNFAQGPVEFNHNTFLDVAGGGPEIIYAETGGSYSQFTFINNIINSEGNGVFDPSFGGSAKTLDNDFPGVVLTANVLAGQSPLDFGSYAQGNFFPANMAAVGFLADPTNGVSNYQDLGLSALSSFVKVSTDGTDPGVSISLLSRQLDNQ